MVRNGYTPARELVTGIGPVKIRQPRVDDRGLDNTDEQLFSSQILPRYLRRVPSVDNLIPILYLKGVSSGDMSEALASILGSDAAGLSATNIVRLKAQWEQGYRAWSAQSFKGKSYVYFWVDGIHFNVRLDEERKRSCILMVMGANTTGRKELLAVSDGYRESKAVAPLSAECGDGNLSAVRGAAVGSPARCVTIPRRARSASMRRWRKSSSLCRSITKGTS